MQRDYANGHGIWTTYIFTEGLAREQNYFSQDAARSRSVKGRYQGHRGQRSRSLCNFIGQKGTHSTIYDLFVLKCGKMFREKHQIIDKILKLLA